MKLKKAFTCKSVDAFRRVVQRFWGTCSHSVPSLTEGMMPMSTYEEFMIILTVALLIVAILDLTHREKQVSRDCRGTRQIFLQALGFSRCSRKKVAVLLSGKV